jgi:Glycosyl transferase family 2
VSLLFLANSVTSLILGIPLVAVVTTGGIALFRRRQQGQFVRELLDKKPHSHQKRVIVSLTTLPDRIHNLEPTIRSLLNQTWPPDEIVLAVPEYSTRQKRPYSVPKYLSQFPMLRILRCKTDWGPATKFIPAVQEELAAGRPDTLIMVVDDDRIYPRDALETYLYYHRQFPDAALCFRGGPMPQNFYWFVPKLFLASRLREPKRVAVITGCGSYLIQPRFFDSTLWDYSDAPPSAFYMDDIWISGNLDRRSVEKYAVPASAMMRTVRQQSGTMSLHRVPRDRTYHNNETVEYFRDTWNVFSSHWTMWLSIFPRLIHFVRQNSESKTCNISSAPRDEDAAAEIVE